jgi:calcium binding protein 39
LKRITKEYVPFAIYTSSSLTLSPLLASLAQFFKAYTPLTNSPNYVTKRQSLKLLGEILLDRSNYATMTRYIADVGNLQGVMNTLRDKSRNIQYEAFHVFKVSIPALFSRS